MYHTNTKFQIPQFHMRTFYSWHVGRRAKIFSPFDALKGFNEAIASKDVLYRERVELSDEDRTELDRRLRILKGLTYNGNMARKNRVKITVLFYAPCPDEHNEAFGIRGRYRKITGICWNVDEIYGKAVEEDHRNPWRGLNRFF